MICADPQCVICVGLEWLEARQSPVEDTFDWDEFIDGYEASE